MHRGRPWRAPRRDERGPLCSAAVCRWGIVGDVRTAATLSHPDAEQPRINDPRQERIDVRDQPQPATRLRPVAEVEAELAEMRQAMAQQRREFDEDASSFAQAIARLSHSERTLGQTKAKFLDALERAEKAEARGAELSTALVKLEAFQRDAADERDLAVRRAREEWAAKSEQRDAEIARLHQVVGAALERELAHEQAIGTLRATETAQKQELEAAHEGTARALAQKEALQEMAESLSRDSAAGAAECARLAESLRGAEEREQLALALAAEARAEHASSLAALTESRARDVQLGERCRELELERDRALTLVASLQSELSRREAKLAFAQCEMAGADRERSHLLGVLGALEALAKQIVTVGLQARTEADAAAGMARESGPEREPVTLKPEAAVRNSPVSLRASTGPEILIDGVRLER